MVAVFGLFGLGVFNYFPVIFGDSFYPLNYVDEIKECSDRFGLDKPLVAALILKESNYNPKAVSRAGAMGLTQVMPRTFQGLLDRAPELQDLGNDPFDPRTNICVGAAYLAGAMANYGGDWTAALISYNGGDGAARRYLAARDSSVLVTETRLYAPKILAAREVYASMYGDNLQKADGVKIGVQSSSEQRNAFWKGFIKDAFARYVKK